MRTILVDHVGNLLCLHQLAGLNVLCMHLGLLIGQAMDVLLDVLKAGVHYGYAFLLVKENVSK